MRQSWLRTLRTLRSPLGAAVAGMLLHRRDMRRRCPVM